MGPRAQRSAGAGGIGKYGSQAAKSDFALPGAGRSAGVRGDKVERAKAGAEGFGGEAGAREPGFVHQPERKSGPPQSIRYARPTGNFSEKSEPAQWTDG